MRYLHHHFHVLGPTVIVHGACGVRRRRLTPGVVVGMRLAQRHPLAGQRHRWLLEQMPWQRLKRGQDLPPQCWHQVDLKPSTQHAGHEEPVGFLRRSRRKDIVALLETKESAAGAHTITRGVQPLRLPRGAGGVEVKLDRLNLAPDP